MRKWVRGILASDVFERLVLLLIVSNCVALGFESRRPGFGETAMGRVLDVLEIVFLTLFTVEMGMKIIAMGLIRQPDAYLRDGPSDLVGNMR